MTDSSQFDENIPLEIHELIGTLRERFEDVCQEGESPRIEDYLPEIDTQYQSVLLRELLRLELNYLFPNGQHPEIQRYLQRFPECSNLVEKVFHETRAYAGNSANPIPNDLPRFGPYIAKRELGRGGFGVVYLATHDEAGHQVAIKVGEHLMIEARTLVSLNHPSITRVLYVGQDAHKRPYLVMDYMAGGSLRDRLVEGRAIDPTQATRIALQIADALHAAHTHTDQIVHRDLKPENILFDHLGDDADAFVSDFGLALSETERVGRRGDFFRDSTVSIA